MTTYTGTITDGSATIEIDTTGMNEGAYDVQTTYTQNNKYTSATKNSTLTLQQASTWTTVDTTDTTQFVGERGYAIPTHNNYVTCNDTTSKGLVYWKQYLAKNMKIDLTIESTNLSNSAIILHSSTRWYGRWRSTQIYEYHGSGSEQTISGLANTSPLHLSYEIDSSGYVHMTDDNLSLTSASAFTDSDLAEMRLGILNWNGTPTDITSMKYMTGGG